MCQLTDREKKRLRYKGGLLLIAISLAVSVVLGAIFALIPLATDGGSYLKGFILMSKTMFFMFAAGIAVGGILLIANIVPENFCVGFGCALYYGTIFLAALLSDYITGATANRYIISFVVVSLICYIVWLKKFKPVEQE